jgi:2-polyprenyl-3-methyl-5-hydroxy-6-metoxy-1,4-benzoquinol methylase
MKTARKVFEEIYATNYWGFGSGHGSRPQVTRGYREFVARFIRENCISSVVDFGCGDWQFSRLIDWSGVDYLGLDVVPQLIERHQTRFGRAGIRFEMCPDRLTDVPSADLLLAKDVLQHWPTSAVQEFLGNVVPRFKWALITNGVTPESHLNGDIEMGGFRPLDLRRVPFSCIAPVVFSFGGDAIRSWRTLRTFNAWHEIVLLFSEQRTPVATGSGRARVSVTGALSVACGRPQIQHVPE